MVAATLNKGRLLFDDLPAEHVCKMFFPNPLFLGCVLSHLPVFVLDVPLVMGSASAAKLASDGVDCPEVTSGGSIIGISSLLLHPGPTIFHEKRSRSFLDGLESRCSVPAQRLHRFAARHGICSFGASRPTARPGTVSREAGVPRKSSDGKEGNLHQADVTLPPCSVPEPQ